MSQTIFVVIGEYQYDETSDHWNVWSFTDHMKALSYAQECQQRLAEYGPKAHAFLHQWSKDHPDAPYQEMNTMRDRAEKQLRARVGDRGLSYYCPDFSLVEYKVEPLKLG
jgi:hypothetical protein